MSHHRTHWALAVAAAVLLMGDRPAVVRGEEPFLAPEQELLLEQMNAARDLGEQSLRSSELLHTASPQLIATLLRHKNPGIALRAAWQRAMICTEGVALSKGAVDNRLPLPREPVATFLGFLEGKAALEVPARWRRTVQAGIFETAGATLFNPVKYSPYRLSESGYVCPEGWEVYTEEDATVIATRGDAIRLEGAARQPLVRQPNIPSLRLTAAVDRFREQSVVFVHEEIPSFGKLFCVSTARPDAILWSRDLRFFFNEGGASGTDAMWAHLDVSKEEYHLFYVWSGAAGILAYAPDGKMLWSFNTDF